jgi:hypothetical protein
MERNKKSMANVYMSVSGEDTIPQLSSGDCSISDTLTVGGAAVFNGSITMNGTTTVINSTDVEITDRVLVVAKGNTADTIDSGLVLEYKEAGTTKHAGIMRDHTDQTMKVFKTSQSLAGATINTADGTFALAPFMASGLETTGLLTVGKRTFSQWSALSPTRGAIVYDTTYGPRLKVGDGTAWQSVMMYPTENVESTAYSGLLANNSNIKRRVIMGCDSGGNPRIDLQAGLTGDKASSVYIDFTVTDNADNDFRIQTDGTTLTLSSSTGSKVFAVTTPMTSVAQTLNGLLTMNERVLLYNRTTTQRDALSTPLAGQLLYNSTTGRVNYRDASAWQEVVYIGGSPTFAALTTTGLTTAGERIGIYSQTTTQRDALGSPLAGQILYNSTTGRLNYRNGSAWQEIPRVNDSSANFAILSVGNSAATGGFQVEAWDGAGCNSNTGNRRNILSIDTGGNPHLEMHAGKTSVNGKAGAIYLDLAMSDDADYDHRFYIASGYANTLNLQQIVGGSIFAIQHNVTIGQTLTVAQTAAVTGNLTVGASKLVVTAASGNTTVAGTLTVAGAVTANAGFTTTGTAAVSIASDATTSSVYIGNNAGKTIMIGDNTTSTPVTIIGSTVNVATNKLCSAANFGYSTIPASSITTTIGTLLGASLTSIQGGSSGIVLNSAVGVVLPVLTTAARNALFSPTAGTTLYNSTLGSIDYYNGSAWQSALVVSNSGFTSTVPYPFGGTVNSRVNYQKVGNVCSVSIEGANGVTNINTEIQFGTALPAGYRPYKLHEYPIWVMDFNDGGNQMGNLTIDTSGVIRIYKSKSGVFSNTSSAVSFPTFEFSYPITSAV